MPQIEIRPAAEADIPILTVLDHNYTSDYVWQMEHNAEEGQIGINFRQIHLPRSVRVEYPRSPAALAEDWQDRSALLVSTHDNEVVGYISINQKLAPVTNWVTDLAIVRRFRRQGIGSALLLAAQEWARQTNSYRMMLEMQPKNYPAISLAQKLGFEFCGYNDHYYANHDIALFFARTLR